MNVVVNWFDELRRRVPIHPPLMHSGRREPGLTPNSTAALPMQPRCGTPVTFRF